jgi:hypothetical protein
MMVVAMALRISVKEQKQRLVIAKDSIPMSCHAAFIDAWYGTNHLACVKLIDVNIT